MTAVAAESSDLVHHLLVDSALKAVIVVVALAVLALGMTVIWRKAGRADDRPGAPDD
ncbi:hypothetical protein ACFVW8_00995 [Streptomyces sp. NPDC058221]|uniref:hypothetical protein n=1 Tax=Streptomyces sp. NPDC058221 TaxID=3346388 RepID=UPI0036E4C8A6